MSRLQFGLPFSPIQTFRPMSSQPRGVNPAVPAPPRPMRPITQYGTVEENANAGMARQQAVAAQMRGIADMQGIQSRLAANGNAQLGYGGLFNQTEPYQPASPYGGSVMPGVVSRGGVTNVVGNLPSAPYVPSREAQDRIDRRKATQERYNVMAQQPLGSNQYNTLTDQGYIRPNAGEQTPRGELQIQPHIGTKGYGSAGPGGGMVGISNYQNIINKMTPDQAKNFNERKAARDAEMDLRKQRQFARAQFRAATGDPGAGVIFNDQNGLDLMSTMAARESADRSPTASEFNPRTGERRVIYGNQANALNSLLEGQRVTALQGAATERLGLDKMIAEAEIEKGKYESGQLTMPPTFKDLLDEDTELNSLPPDQLDQRFHSASGLFEKNPSDPEASRVMDTFGDNFIIESYSNLLKNPNWISQLTPGEVAIRDRKIENLRREAKRRGLTLPVGDVENNPYLNNPIRDYTSELTFD